MPFFCIDLRGLFPVHYVDGARVTQDEYLEMLDAYQKSSPFV